MALTCPKCSRLNPDEALYCFNDGLALRSYQAPVSANRLGRAFVFPSGRSCNTFDELVDGCLDFWSDAREFLRAGVFASYLGGLGRADLARAAQEAEKHPDPDRGLDDLLSRLPADNRTGPKLSVHTTEIDLGTLSAGEDQQLEIRIKNLGRGLLHGSVSCEAYWLSASSTGEQKQKLFQTLDEVVIPLHVRGKVLRASHKPIEAQLTLESSGGSALVTVRAKVPVKPFPAGPLAGAVTPREVAQKAKVHARDAIPLFEGGAVARWYESNGWTYPVQGPTAAGLGAVQQFFEALGLTPPPKVEISQAALNFQGAAGDTLTPQVVQVSTPEKRPVYAHASADQPWLKVGIVRMGGRTVDIPVSVDVPEESSRGARLNGTMTITSNGNQKFYVPVSVSVTEGPKRIAPVAPALAAAAIPPTIAPEALTAPYRAPAAIPLAPAPAAVPMTAGPVTAAPPPPPAPRLPTGPSGSSSASPSSSVGELTLDVSPGSVPGAVPRRKWLDSGTRWLPYCPVAFLALVLLVTFVRDLVTRPAGAEEDEGWANVPKKDPVQLIDVAFHDSVENVTLGTGGAKENVSGEAGRRPATWDPSMRFGLMTRPASSKDKKDEGDDEKKPKRLTFYKTGLTNNAVVRLDGRDYLYGERPFKLLDGKLIDDTPGKWAGRWRERDVPIEGKDRWGRERRGKRSVWHYDRENVTITQHVEIIVGQSGDHDTLLVQFEIENGSSEEHEVGLRFLLDTFIGNNDGVPFLIPGQESLINTQFGFGKTDSHPEFVQMRSRREWAEEIPAFLQARESEDLTNPGTVAQVGILIEGLERPDRVTLGSYPDVQLNSRDNRCLQEKTMWLVPVLSIQSLRPADSCVVMYWNPKPIAPKSKRLLGFTYGLGYLASSKGKLALTAGGSFTPRGDITVTAYVSNPTPDMTVTLNLPEGFELVEGKATRPVPPLGAVGKSSPVSWKIRAGRKTGEFKVEAETSTKLRESHSIIIRPSGLFGR